MSIEVNKFIEQSMKNFIMMCATKPKPPISKECIKIQLMTKPSPLIKPLPFSYGKL